MNWESQVIAFLSATLLRPFLLAACAWLLLRTLQIRHPASRHAVWTAVLSGMLLLPFVSVWTPHWAMPVLPYKPARAVTEPLPDSRDSAEPTTPAPVESAPSRDREGVVLQRPVIDHPILWLYLAGLLAMLLYRAAGWILMRRVVSRSKPLRAPHLRESADVVSPVAVGVFRPAVLLPVGWRDWNSATRSAVFAHEFAHLRRHDTLVASLARLLKGMLWFHPLAWWVSRQISELAELACDAEALKIVRDPGGYSRVLLQFASGVNDAGYRVALPGLAIANSTALGKRIDQVFELSRGDLRRLQRPGAVLALMGVPAMCVAATLGLGSAGAALSRVELNSFLRIPLAPLIPQAVLAQVRTQTPASPAPVRDRSVVGPRFETASLELAAPPVSGELCWGGCGGPLSPYPESRDEITYRHFTLRKILVRAYNVKDYLISGSKSLDTDFYDVVAKAAPGTTQDQFQLMLQSLLAERLKLAVHLETTDLVSGYDLVVADGGSKLETGQADAPGTPFDGVPGLVGLNTGSGFVLLSAANSEAAPSGVPPSVSLLANVLSAALRVPVVDRTKLTGRFNINYQGFLPVVSVRLRPDGKAAEIAVSTEPADLPTVRDGLARLGLALEEKKTSQDVLVVDHVDSLPAVK